MIEMKSTSGEGLGKSTQAVLSVQGEAGGNPFGGINMAADNSSTHVFRNTDAVIAHQEGLDDSYEYGRTTNGTVKRAETALKILCNAKWATLVASGMNAMNTVLFATLRQGDHVVIGDDCYRRTKSVLRNRMSAFGVTTSVVPMGDYSAIADELRDTTRLIIMEAPTNPRLRVVDLEKIVELGKRAGAYTVIDSTLASPYNLRPLEFGIDLVVESATKYIGGHHHNLLGYIAGRDKLQQEIVAVRDDGIGAIPSGVVAEQLLLAIQTFGLRMARHNANGQLIAEFLESHPKVEQVWYPGLKSHRDHEIAKAQMEGFGGLVTFTVRGGFEAAKTLVDAMKLARIAASLGGAISLIEQPLVMSYWKAAPEVREKAGILPNMIRYASGVEDAKDLIAELKRALEKV